MLLRSFARAIRNSILLIALVAAFTGCNRHSGSSSSSEVVLYTSVDEPYVRPLIEKFQAQTGIHVTLLTDAEASKSVGLAERIRAEKDHPQADVWWDNECFLAINLADEGILASYESPAAADIPAAYKDPHHRWAASALRVRVLVSSLPNSDPSWQPASHLRDLLRPDWKGRIAIARPTAGTTGGHVAALYVLWGEQRAQEFFRGLHDNGVKLLGGNSVVADSVARGDIIAGLCDNDDAADAAAQGGKIETRLPDQREGEDGTLAIPCTVSLVADCPHPQPARRLIDFLLSAQVDRELIDKKFAWCSTRQVPQNVRLMHVDYRSVAKAMPGAIRASTSLLEGR